MAEPFHEGTALYTGRLHLLTSCTRCLLDVPESTWAACLACRFAQIAAKQFKTISMTKHLRQSNVDLRLKLIEIKTGLQTSATLDHRCTTANLYDGSYSKTTQF